METPTKYFLSFPLFSVKQMERLRVCFTLVNVCRKCDNTAMDIGAVSLIKVLLRNTAVLPYLALLQVMTFVVKPNGIYLFPQAAYSSQLLNSKQTLQNKRVRENHLCAIIFPS